MSIKDHVLEVKSVSKSFGGVRANRDISMGVERGSIVGLIGPNGSGKTTLFHSIVGYHGVDSGSIALEGQPLTSLRVGSIARLGLLRTFQQTRVFTAMDCMENMAIAISNRRAGVLSMFKRVSPEIVERSESLLDFVGLYEKRHLVAGSLSFGQRKLLEFAMALMNDPKVLLLDEPTAGINPTLINGLIDRLRRANQELGITLVVIEHNMRVVMNLADHLYCLAHGAVLCEGSPEAVRTDARVLEAYLGG